MTDWLDDPNDVTWAETRMDDMDDRAWAERERYEDEHSFPTTLADAHRDWHAVHGQYAVCDLDCGASEALYAQDEEGEYYYVGEPASTDEADLMDFSDYMNDDEPPF